MRTQRIAVLLATTVTLVSCRSVESKLVDLAGGVFLVTLCLVTLKLMMPTLAETRVFKRLSSALVNRSAVFVMPLAIGGALFLLLGLLLGGLERVLVFPGFTLLIAAWYLRSYAKGRDDSVKRRDFEIVVLCMGVFFVFLFIWLAGGAMLASIG